MLRCKNKIWLENISELFCSFNIIPLEGMSLEGQLNALTRLVICVFLVLMLLGYKHHFLFLLLSLVFIVILYYIQKKSIEPFQFDKTEQYTSKGVQLGSGTLNKIKDGCLMNSGRFCNDKRDIVTGPSLKSTNQRLVGPPNPKTLVAPVIASPSADLDYWRANNLVTHSAVNEETQNDLYQSGYQISTCSGNSNGRYMIPQQSYQKEYIPEEGLLKNQEMQVKTQETMNQIDNNLQENFEYPYEISPDYPGQINTSCGYNPEQLPQAGLPTNFPAGNCQMNPKFKKYNENMFTSTVQPGLYYRTEVNEPINSNIGISFQQQFEPRTCEVGPHGVTYTAHDSRLLKAKPIEPNMDVINAVSESNVFDPRHSGYGTSYRAYTDDRMGQTRFFYDDIDAVRMPNYIARNDIDFAPYADQYGPIPEGDEEGNKYTSDIRALANDTFLRETIKQRSELQTRLMRKNNANSWQQKMFPIHKRNQRMLGMGCM